MALLSQQTGSLIPVISIGRLRQDVFIFEITWLQNIIVLKPCNVTISYYAYTQKKML